MAGGSVKLSLAQDIRTSLSWTLTNSVYSSVLLFPLLCTICFPFPVSSETQILQSISRRQGLFRVVIASDTLGSKEMKTVVISQSLCSKVNSPPHLLFLQLFYPPSALVHIPYTKQSEYLLCFKGSPYSVWLLKSWSQLVQSWLVAWSSHNFHSPRTANNELNCVLIRCLSSTLCVLLCICFFFCKFYLVRSISSVERSNADVKLKKISPDKCTLNWMRTFPPVKWP